MKKGVFKKGVFKKATRKRVNKKGIKKGFEKPAKIPKQTKENGADFILAVISAAGQILVAFPGVGFADPAELVASPISGVD